MSATQQFSQALLTEHLLIVSCQAYRSQEALLELARSLDNPGRKLCLALPYAALVENHSALSSMNIWKGLSDTYSLDPDTFPGPVAIRMAKEANIDFAVIGGPISRNVLYESEQNLAAKIRGLLDVAITPVVCFGETLADYLRGSSREVIKGQLSALLLGLSFDQLSRVILVYKAPWTDYIAPEHFADESDKSQMVVLEVMHHLFGADVISHIPLLTNLPYATEDFKKISHEIPPSGYFLELAGKDPSLVADYFYILTQEAVIPYTSKAAKPSLAPIEETAPEVILKPKKPRKKKIEVKPEPSVIEETAVPTETSEIETFNEVVEESLHESILAVENDLAEPTIQFDLHETTEIGLEEPPSVIENEDSAFDWFTDEELEALQKEFGIGSDGKIHPKPLPVWDNSHNVRVIPTQAQKNETPGKKQKKS